jgi:hypothetical protein
VRWSPMQAMFANTGPFVQFVLARLRAADTREVIFSVGDSEGGEES